MKPSSESIYYNDLSPYFVKDPLNKDSFLIPPPNLASLVTDSTTRISGPNVQPINLFDNYTELLTEILIRLPYQMKKLCLSSSAVPSSSDQILTKYQQSLSQITGMFEFSAWTHYLCEYLLLRQCHYLKRLIKKLLQILSGSKDKYRKFKDQHILITSLKSLVILCGLESSPEPQSMLNMGGSIVMATESLSTVNEINHGMLPLIYFNLIKPNKIISALFCLMTNLIIDNHIKYY